MSSNCAPGWQTFPARKVTSNGSLASSKLDTSSSAMDKENYDEGSIHRNGTSEIYPTARRSASVCLGESRKGFPGNNSEPALRKCGGSLGKSSTNSWLNKCRPGVSKFTPPRLVGVSKFVSPRSVEPKVKVDNSRSSDRIKATGRAVGDIISCQSLDAAPFEETAEKRKLILDENFPEPKKYRVEDNTEDDVVACTPLLDITNVSRDITDRFCKRKETHYQEITVSQRSFWIDDKEICDILPSDVVEDPIAGREEWIEEEHCIAGKLPEVDDMGLEETENGADDMSLPEALQKIFRACEAEKPHDECQNASYNGTFEFDTVEKIVCSPEPMSPEEKRRQILRAIDPRAVSSDFHLRSSGNEGGLCWISSPDNNKILENQSSGISKCENGSSFSPGDAFWDEAFEAVSGIMVSNSDKRAPGSPGYQISVDVARGADIIKVNGRPDSQEVQVKVFEELAKAATQQITLKEKSAGKPVLASEDDNRTANGNAAGWYDDLDSSPLPVRRFNFSDQENVPNESIDRVVNGEVLDVFHTMIPPRFPLVEASIEVDPLKTAGVPSELLESSLAFVRGGVELERGNHNLTVVKLKPQYKVELCKWLPPELCSFFAKKGLTKLYQWQVLHEFSRWYPVSLFYVH